VTLGVCGVLIALYSTIWRSSLVGMAVRVAGLGLLLMLVFGLLEQWPRRLPRWLARWVLQVLAVGLTVPVALFFIYLLSTAPGAPPFWKVEDRMGGFAVLMVSGLLIAPWVALGALVRQREAFAREQALAFQLERSELERQASDARLHLLRAQVQPHFIFNTLANVRALVNTGSPQAPHVLDHLIDYLRAAVPRLDATATTLADELHLVRAYLELMRMRLPDRMQFAIHVDDEALPLTCPPMTLMTLVENAVRHGIDPAEEGGLIEVRVNVREGRCHVVVSDTGAGLQPTDGEVGRARAAGGSLGTGLTGLRERLALAFGGDAHLRIEAHAPRGVRADVDFPARRAA